MNVLDTTSILGGYGQSIVDWMVGDDRSFSGDVNGLLQSGDAVTDAYFTLKSSAISPDVYAIIQKHITQTLSSAGQITQSTTGSPPLEQTVLLFNVYSADYEGLAFAGTSYYWDFRVITVKGRSYTVAQGNVNFQQGVTQTNIAGTPGPLPMGPNNGQPRFRGFAIRNPMYIPNIEGTFVLGDWFRNSAPTVSNSPSGWVCVSGGSLPNPPGAALFEDDGYVSAITGFRGVFSGIPPGPANTNDWFLMMPFVAGQFMFWVCTKGDPVNPIWNPAASIGL
jgi:hypothetical protein